jgi:hypothetical protein
MEHVTEVMNRSLVGVTPDTCVREAESVAGRQGVHHLLVLDCDDLVGILSVRDLRRADPAKRVCECMSSPVRTIRASASLAEARSVMCRHAIASGLKSGCSWPKASLQSAPLLLFVALGANRSQHGHPLVPQTFVADVAVALALVRA